MVKTIRALRELIVWEMEDKGIPSISYVLVDGDDVSVEHLGEGVGAGAYFRVGSCTKMITALAVAQLVARGLLELDADVTAYMPDFRPPNPFARPGKEGTGITLRRVLSHTAGLVREPGVGHYMDGSSPPLRETIESIKDIPLKYDPEANSFHYSNAGFALLGYLVEEVSGVEYVGYVQENLLGPVGMREAAFSLTEEVRKRLAPAWMWNLEGDFPAPVFDLGSVPAGNLYATLDDMAAFMRALLRKSIPGIGEEILGSMWEPAVPTGRGGHWGLGFAVGELRGFRWVGHGGAVYGYATQLMVLPDAGIGACVVSTIDASNVVAGRIARYALELLLAEKGLGPVPPSPARPSPLAPEHLASLPGTYRDPGSGELVEVLERKGKLYLLGDGVPLRLRPREGRAFLVDGRVFGPGSAYPHLEVEFSHGDPAPALTWKGRVWERVPRPEPRIPPPELLPHLGEYGPDFNPARIFYEGGKLRCLMEYFYTHTLEPLGEGRYRMHGLLYEDEVLVLVLGARDGEGRPGIMVGPMFLPRR